MLRPFQGLAYLLTGWVPRNRDLWAFGSWSGHRFTDNAAAVFLHLAANPRAGVATVWITRRRSIRDELRAAGHHAELALSPRGMWLSARAGVHLYDSLPKDVNFWFSRGAKLVLLRHGIGLKKIERAIDNPSHRLHKLFHGNPVQRLAWGIALPWHLPVPDLVASCSPEHADQAVGFFAVPRDRVEITGFARHDRLAHAGSPRRDRLPVVGAAVPADRPVFLYLPTFREGAARQRFDWDVLARAAAEAEVTIAVKLHFVDAQRGVHGVDDIVASDHLRLLDPTSDPVDLYTDADGLITDFSSAAFDFLLLGRPIIYYVPDHEQFRRDRPLMFDLDEVAAGPICTDEATLAGALRAARSGDLGEHGERHRLLRERFHTYPPGEASRRVVESTIRMIRPTGENAQTVTA